MQNLMNLSIGSPRALLLLTRDPSVDSNCCLWPMHYAAIAEASGIICLGTMIALNISRQGESKAGQGCWDLQGSTWVFICIWGEVFLFCRTGQMPRAGEQQECLGFRAGWHFRMRLLANSCDYKMPVIKLKILCLLSIVSLPVQ